MTSNEFREILAMVIFDRWKGIIEPGPYLCNRLAIVKGHVIKHYDIKYSRFITSYGWWIERKSAMDLMGPKCYICKKRKAYDVHHVTYQFGWTPYFIRDYDEHENETPVLIPLCRVCHAKQHHGRE